ncbi:MAG: glycosyltransferase family 4 protein [Pirellulales bacterium]|nr:glycosyltransferase family 4 protein [Pirellulales bacterium]
MVDYLGFFVGGKADKVTTMRILVATAFAVPHEGGLSTHVELLCHGLRANGHEVLLLEGRSFQSSLICRVWRRLRQHVCPATSARLIANSHGLLRRAQGIGQRTYDTFHPDVIHCHDPSASLAMSRVAEGRVPVVETVHGPALYEIKMHRGAGYEEFYREISRIEEKAFSGASFLLPVDTGQAEILQRDYHVPASKMDVVFNCVDVEEVRELSRRKPEWDIPDSYFLVPRRLVEKTGVRYAIEAMTFLEPQSVRLLVAGDGVQRHELEMYARELGVQDRVVFLGNVPRRKLMPLFSRAIGVLVPSVPASGVVEATSLAVTEAMAAGTVPIASAIGGLAELIEDGKTGFLVPPGDARGLASAMRKIMEGEVRLGLIESGCKAVEEKYDIARWIDRIEGHYRRLVGELQS